MRRVFIIAWHPSLLAAIAARENSIDRECITSPLLMLDFA